MSHVYKDCEVKTRCYQNDDKKNDNMPIDCWQTTQIKSISRATSTFQPDAIATNIWPREATIQKPNKLKKMLQEPTTICMELRDQLNGQYIINVERDIVNFAQAEMYFLQSVSPTIFLANTK